MMKRALKPDGTPTGAKDERGVLLDLSARDVEALGKAGGNPAAYLEERRRQLEEHEEKQREADAKERWIARFVEAGGDRSAASAAWQASRNEAAAEVAAQADTEAARRTRRRISGRL